MLIHKKKKAIILRLKDPERVLSVIPKARKFLFKGKEYVAIPHRRDEVKVLNNIGINAPSPMEFYYDWPGRFKPFEAQRVAACFMAQHNRCFNLSSMGTGKTMATLWAYDYMRSIGTVRKALVISPLSTLDRTWADEVFNHFPHLTTAVLYGSKEKRLKMLATDADLYLINHDGIKINGLLEAINARDDIDLIIIDELSQVARTASSDRWKVLAKLVRHTLSDGSSRKVIGLTGTPTPNNPTDAWAQCRLLVPDAVPPYFNSFKMQVMRQISQFVWVPREDAQEVVYEAMQPAIRFSREECVDLPECVYQTREVELSPAQKKAYKDMLAKLQAEFESGEVTAVNAAVKAQKLLQIVCGVVLGKDGEEHVVDAKPRMEVVKEIIEEAEGKVLVFVPFRASLNALTDYLRKHFTVELVHGGVSKGERDRIFSAFQKTKEPRVLVAQPACLSHGLTLTEANTIVWFAPITSSDTYTQSCARITRPGQRRTQFIVNIEGSDLERKFYKRLGDKQRAENVLLDMFVEARRALET
jgi:SNF2 family DNA or RNA helicase